MESVLEKINEHRRRGDELSCNQELFDQAIQEYKRAIELARNNGTQIALTGSTIDDFVSIASSGIGYCHRQQGNREEAGKHVTEAIRLSQQGKTLSARGRAYEEMGLILRLMDYNHCGAMDNTRNAIEFYETALNPERLPTETKVYTKEELTHRLLRAYGLVSTNIRDVSRTLKQDYVEGRRRLLKEADEFATKEVKKRNELGQRNANAYHTRSNIRTELILVAESDKEKKGFYQAAKLDIEIALEYCEELEEESRRRNKANIFYAHFKAEDNFRPDSEEARKSLSVFIASIQNLSKQDILEFMDEQNLGEDAKRYNLDDVLKERVRKKLEG